jgi:hypothetical protein
MRRALVILFAASVLFHAQPAASQQTQGPATSFERLRGLLNPGDIVVVTDAEGHRIEGRLADISNAAIVLRGGRGARQRGRAGPKVRCDRCR